MYRALSARCNYLAQDRSDIRFAVKELSRKMSKPRVKDAEAMKRLGRYLLRAKRMVTVYGKQTWMKFIEGWRDSNYAGCLETRKSTSGGIIKIGSHILKGWSTTQAVIA